MIYSQNEINRLIERVRGSGYKIICTSMGADPITIGHTRCLIESAKLKYGNSAKLVVIVNDDQFLINKKGYRFMTAQERAEIIDSIMGVDHVLIWYDGTQNVAEALRQLKPIYFTKGGDRSSPESIDEKEREVCHEIGCEIKYGVGGFTKVQSSSELLARFKMGPNPYTKPLGIQPTYNKVHDGPRLAIWENENGDQCILDKQGIEKCVF